MRTGTVPLLRARLLPGRAPVLAEIPTPAPPTRPGPSLGAAPPPRFRPIEAASELLGITSPESRRQTEAARATAEVVARERGETLPAFREGMIGPQTPLERAARGVQRGTLGAAESLTGAVQWLEGVLGAKTPVGAAAEEVGAWLQQRVESVQPADPGFADRLAEGFGSMGAFLIPGIGTTMGMARVAQIAPRIAKIVGMSQAVVTEALAEAGDSYRNMLAAGMASDQASRRAGRVFGENVVLIGVTNRLGIFADAGSAVAKASKSALMEGAQEFGQYEIQQRASGQPFRLGEAAEAGAIGAIVGGGTGLALRQLERPEVSRSLPSRPPPPPPPPAPQPPEGVLRETPQAPGGARIDEGARPATIPPGAPEPPPAPRPAPSGVEIGGPAVVQTLQPAPLDVAALDRLDEGQVVLPDMPDLEGRTLMTGERVRDLLGVEPRQATEQGWVSRDAEGGYRITQAGQAEALRLGPVGSGARPVQPAPVEPTQRWYMATSLEPAAPPPATPPAPAAPAPRPLPGRAARLEVPAAPSPDAAPSRPEPWEITRQTYATMLARDRLGGRRAVPILDARDHDAHEAAVRQAVADGKPVPEIVLRDYPDLSAAPSPAAPAFSQKLYQGRGATPEQTYGEENVKAGRGHPLVGPGDYYTFTRKDAKTFGTVTEHQVALRNPYVLTSDRQWFDLLVAAQAGQLSSVGREQGPTEAAAQRLQDYLVAQGHDGLVVRFPSAREGDVGETGQSIKRVRESFGASQVVVFGPERPPALAARPLPGRVSPPAAPTQAALDHQREVLLDSLKAMKPGAQTKVAGEWWSKTFDEYIPWVSTAGVHHTSTELAGLATAADLDSLAARASEPAPPAAPPGSTIEAEGGGRRDLPGRVRQRPGPQDREPLAGAPPADGEGARGEGAPPAERERGGGTDVGRDVSPDLGAGPPAQPGVGAREGGVGVSPERGGPAAPRGEPGGDDRAGEGLARRGRERPEPEPAPARDYRITDADRIGEGSPREKARRNVDAIRLLKAIEEAGRTATPDEQRVLVQYTGWGQFPQVFQEESRVPREWQGVREELTGLLTPDEFAAARASTPNAHYTTPAVIGAMWRALERLGLRAGGTVLEPALGAGHFFGAMPENLRSDTKRTGIELDPITGRIAALLYPEANITVAGFEAVRLPTDFFDAAISNVPFGNYGVHDPRYRKTPFVTRSIHDYFFARALDVVRPGGIVAFVTSSYTLDKVDSGMRRYLADRANLLGAIRLPNTAFKGNAGTEVTTDVIFLQKRPPQTPATGETWQALDPVTGKNGAEIPVNEYFARHPEMMLGQMALEGTMYRDNTPTLVGTVTPEALEAAVARLPENVVTAWEGPEIVRGWDLASNVTEVKDGGYTVKDGLVVVKEGAYLKPADLPTSAVPRVKGMLRVRDTLNEVIRTQLEERPEAEIVAAREALGKEYDAYVRRHGYLSARDNLRAFDGDPDHPRLLALEEWDPDAKTATKAAIFTRRTIERYTPVQSAESGTEALTVSLNERGRVDWIRMQELTGRTPKELQDELGDLVYRNPEGGAWETADAYLSGNVRAKLATAEAAAKADKAFARNAEALKRVQPKDLEPEEIEVRLGAGWVPAADYRAFIREITELAEHGLKVRYIEPLATWKVTVPDWNRDTVANAQTWGTSRMYAHELIDDAMNLRTPTVWDVIRDSEGERRVVNQQETTAAREQQQKIMDRFKVWVWEDAERADRLAQAYNEGYNNLRLREYDGRHLTLPGSSPLLQLRPHQKNAVWRSVQNPTTLLAHVVGAGKTFTMAATAMELRRMGLVKKPMFVVPNHLVEQWGAEFLRLYPGANVLIAGKESFATGRRQRLMARIASGTYDAVIVGHRSFEFLPVSDATFRAYMQEQLDTLEHFIRESRANKDDARVVKELENAKKRLEAKLKTRASRETKDQAIAFEELGVDALFVDEAHAFKNLFFPTKMTRVAGLPNTESNRAFDMFIKTHWLTRLGGRVVFATGTPISNTMAEMFTMQRYLQMGALAEQGLAHFDAWAQQYGQKVTSLELAPDGSGYRVHTRFAKFTNIPELVTQFRLVADVQTDAMLKLPRPKIAGGKPRIVAATGSPALRAFVQILVQRAEDLKKKRVDPRVDNMLKITGDGRKAALDMRLVMPAALDDPGSKPNLAVAEIHRVWQGSAKDRLTQLVFIDFSTPKGKGGGFSVYDDMKAKLVRRGIPDKEVAFIHDADTDVAKKQLFDAVNAGRVRILFGSTEKMGVGMNVQKRLVALHHLDAPWRPSDIEQREGRILRQGNDNAEAMILRYVTEGSFDAYMWQTLETKKRFIDSVMRGDVSVRSAEDVEGGALTYAEVKAIASGNPAVMEKVKVDTEVRRFDQLRAHYQHARLQMTRQIATLPGTITAREAFREHLKADLARRDAHAGDFSITVSGRVFTGKGAREEAGKALWTQILTRFSQTEPVSVGSYRGFEVEVQGFENKDITPTLTLRGEAKHNVVVNAENPTGTINSIESVLTHLDGKEAAVRGEIADLTKKIGQLKAEVDKPFEHEAKLKALVERQQQINKSLDLDKGDQQAEEMAPAQEAETSAEAAGVEPAEVDEEPPSLSDLGGKDPADQVTEDNLRQVREEQAERQKREGGEEVGASFLPGLLRRLPGRGAPPPPPEAPGGPRGFRGHEAPPDEAIERALTSTASRSKLAGLGQRIVAAYRRVRRAPPFAWDMRPHPLERDEIRVFQAERRRAWEKAGEDVTGVVGRLVDRGELEHFTRIVVLRDFRARLADPERFPGGVPEGLALGQVEAEIERMESSAPPRVREALDAHARLMDAEREDLETRGLLNEDRAIADYFPHFVLDFGGRPGGPGAPRRMQAPGRSFLKRAVGSERDIETDYITAIFRHRAQVRWANAVDDFALTILERHDRRDALDPEVRRRLHPGQEVMVGGETYRAIQYKPGRSIFQVETIPEEALAQAIASGASTLEVDLEDVRRRGALGRWRKIYVVPKAIAERFEHWAPDEAQGLLKVANEATSRWKGVTIGFWGQAGNMMNLMGDVMNLARTPGALLQLPAAAIEVVRWQRGTPSELVTLMEKYDAINSGYVGNEIHFRAKVPELRQFLSAAEVMKQIAKNRVGGLLGGAAVGGIAGGPAGAVAGGALGAMLGARGYFITLPEVREAWPRIAMARYQMRRLERGRPLRPGPSDIGGLEGERAAMKIAREFTVDYGKFTPEENTLLRGFLLPFYSWTRQNTPNWLRFLWMSKVGLLAFFGTRLLLELWNNDDEERRAVEQSLPAYKRTAAHVVTGWKDEAGKMIVIYWVGDPMMDALGMVGQAGTLNRLSGLMTGRLELSQAARQQLAALAKEPSQRAVGLLTPLLKVPVELATGRSSLTGAEIVPPELRGTSEATTRQIRHAAESAVRPIRETRMLREHAGKKEGVDWLSHRFGLGLPVERVEPQEAAAKVALSRWHEARQEFVESVVSQLKDSPAYTKLPPHQQEILLRQAAQQASSEFGKQVPSPYPRRERLRRRLAE